MITVSIKNAAFNKDFGGLLARTKNPTGMLMVCGRELGNQLKAHFRKKEATEPNKLSPRRQHFWLQVGRSVQNPVQSGPKSVSVTISDPRFAQKVFGGTITAKRAGALTIPVSEKAYGRTASTFERETGLKLILIKVGGTKSKNGSGSNRLENAVLAARLPGGGLEVEYVLTKSVRQQKDPTALPDENQLKAAIIKRAQSYMDRELLPGGGNQR